MLRFCASASTCKSQLALVRQRRAYQSALVGLHPIGRRRRPQPHRKIIDNAHTHFLSDGMGRTKKPLVCGARVCAQHRNGTDQSIHLLIRPLSTIDLCLIGAVYASFLCHLNVGVLERFACGLAARQNRKQIFQLPLDLRCVRCTTLIRCPLHYHTRGHNLLQMTRKCCPHDAYTHLLHIATAT